MPLPLRAEAIDPRLENYWRLEIRGINIGAIQEVDMPDIEIGEAMFNDGRVDIKVNTVAKYGDLTFRKIQTSTAADLAIFAWFTSAFDPLTGKIGNPSAIKRNGSLVHVDGSGNDVERYALVGLKPKKKTGQKLKRKDPGILIEEATFSVDSFTQEALA
jgi:hypothetical protein